jgi:hypothetical protein
LDASHRGDSHKRKRYYAVSASSGLQSSATYDTSNHDEGKQDLDGDGETPRDLPGRIEESEINPVGRHDSLQRQTVAPLGGRCSAYEGDKGSLDEDELASALRRGAFGLIRRDRAREETISDTGDDSRDQHHGVIDGGGLQDRANNHDTSTSGRQDEECVRNLPHSQSDGVPPAQSVADEQVGQCPS